MALIGEFEVAVKQADPNREPDQFKFCGELFTVSDRDLTVTLGRFARAAQSGLDTAEMDGLAAMMGLIEAVVIDEDRARFLDLAERKGADPEVLFKIVQAVVEAQTGRPTEQPSDSSAGLSTTGESSKALSPLGAVPPIQLDPRIQALQPLDAAALSLVG